MSDIFETNDNGESKALPQSNPPAEDNSADENGDLAEFGFLHADEGNTPPAEDGTAVESNGAEPAAENTAGEGEDSPEQPEGGKGKSVFTKKLLKMGAAYPAQVALYGLFKVLTWVINIVLTVALVGMISVAAVIAAFVIYIQSSMDFTYTGLENLRFESAQQTTVTYVNEVGEEIVIDTFTGAENRTWASYDEIPADLINAFVAIEDKRYWEHPGVDYRRTANAVIGFFVSSGDKSGGSTITQQLIKNVTGDDDATIQRKVQEIIRAMYVGQNYSKEEVLEMYLNTIFLSQNSYGVKAAAQTYFGKELDELTLIECAALASIPKSPTKYDPLRNPYQNQLRRDLVLEQMLEQSLDEDGNFLPDAIITQAEYDLYHGAPLELNTDSEEEYSETVHSYYMDALVDDVVAELCETYGYDVATASRMLYSGGLTIVCNMDPLVQESMERVFEQTSNDYLYLKGEDVPTTSGVIPQAAMVVMDPRTGKVLGIVGGRGEKKESRGLNRATQSRRQCGSSIKPISLYTLGIDAGIITYGSAVDDVPSMKIEDDRYWPTNTPDRFYGMIDVNFAVIKSLNTIPVWLVNRLGVDTCFDFLTETLGFTSLVEREETSTGIFSDKALAPLALGGFTYGVTTREMAQGYCMIANGGKTSEGQLFSEIRDNKGNILIKKTPKHKVAVSESSAYSMTAMLINVVTQSGATGTRVQMDEKYDVQVAGKTGSTNDDRDRYFVGYTPEYVGAVWFGYDNNKSLTGFPYNPAISLWDRVFDNIYAGLENNGVEYEKQFAVPSGMVTVQYCSVSGKLATESCYRDIYYYDSAKNAFTGSAVRKGVFAKGTQPTEKCDCHIDVRYDRVTGGICFDFCECPAANLITVAFRLNQDRAFDSYVSVQDGDCIYKEVPAGYVYPTDSTVPFFANLYPAGTYFGVKNKSPRNRVCTVHMKEQTVGGETSTDTSTEASTEVVP